MLRGMLSDQYPHVLGTVLAVGTRRSATGGPSTLTGVGWHEAVQTSAGAGQITPLLPDGSCTSHRALRASAMSV